MRLFERTIFDDPRHPTRVTVCWQSGMMFSFTLPEALSECAEVAMGARESVNRLERFRPSVGMPMELHVNGGLAWIAFTPMQGGDVQTVCFPP